MSLFYENKKILLRNEDGFLISFWKEPRCKHRKERADGRCWRHNDYRINLFSSVRHVTAKVFVYWSKIWYSIVVQNCCDCQEGWNEKYEPFGGVHGFYSHDWRLSKIFNLMAAKIVNKLQKNWSKTNRRYCCTTIW